MHHDNLILLISLVLAGIAAFLYRLRKDSYRPWVGIVFLIAMAGTYILIRFIKWAWVHWALQR